MSSTESTTTASDTPLTGQPQVVVVKKQDKQAQLARKKTMSEKIRTSANEIYLKSLDILKTRFRVVGIAPTVTNLGDLTPEQQTQALKDRSQILAAVNTSEKTKHLSAQRRASIASSLSQGVETVKKHADFLEELDKIAEDITGRQAGTITAGRAVSEKRLDLLSNKTEDLKREFSEATTQMDNELEPLIDDGDDNEGGEDNIERNEDRTTHKIRDDNMGEYGNTAPRARETAYYLSETELKKRYNVSFSSRSFIHDIEDDFKNSYLIPSFLRT